MTSIWTSRADSSVMIVCWHSIKSIITCNDHLVKSAVQNKFTKQCIYVYVWVPFGLRTDSHNGRKFFKCKLTMRLSLTPIFSCWDSGYKNFKNWSIKVASFFLSLWRNKSVESCLYNSAYGKLCVVGIAFWNIMSSTVFYLIVVPGAMSWLKIRIIKIQLANT